MIFFIRSTLFIITYFVIASVCIIIPPSIQIARSIRLHFRRLVFQQFHSDFCCVHSSSCVWFLDSQGWLITWLLYFVVIIVYSLHLLLYSRRQLHRMWLVVCSWGSGGGRMCARTGPTSGFSSLWRTWPRYLPWTLVRRVMLHLFCFLCFNSVLSYYTICYVLCAVCCAPSFAHFISYI